MSDIVRRHWAKGMALFLGCSGAAYGALIGGMLGGAIGALAGALPPMLVERSVRREQAFRDLEGVREVTLPHGPASLLNPRRGVVPFFGREVELADLLAWCDGDTVGRLRLLIGSGGVGKTRLALELVKHLEDRGWHCIVVGDGRLAEAVGAVRAVTSGRALLVVDYAETRPDINKLLVATARDDGPLRVLLLARSADEWWERLKRTDPGVRTLVDMAGPVHLSPIVSSDRSQADVIQEATSRFAEAIGVEVPATDVQGDPNVPVLVAHAAALVAVLDASNSGTPRRDDKVSVFVDRHSVLADLMGHEARYWASQTSADGLDSVAQGRTVAVITLLGAGDEAETATVLERVPDLRGSPELQRRSIARWLRGLYPGDDGDWLGRLEPDLLAEHHVTEQLARSPEFTAACLQDLTPEQTVRALIILGRACDHHAAANELLVGAMLSDPERMATAALVVAAQIGGLAERLVNEHFATADLPHPLLTDIVRSIPHPTVAFADLAATVAGRAVETLPTDATPAERARWLSHYGIRLAAVDRAADAVAITEEAVRLRRRLVDVDRDQHLPELALSLDNLAVNLARNGDATRALTAAKEAVALYRELAEAESKYLYDLGIALNNLGGSLRRTNDGAASLDIIKEVIEIRRRLVESHPGDTTKQADLAVSLVNLGVSWASVDRPLNGLPALKESATLYRELASSDPDQHLPGFADALRAMRPCLVDASDLAYAISTSEEEVSVRRRLATRGSDGHQVLLATALAHLGTLLARSGRTTDALLVTEEAVGIARSLTDADLGGSRSTMALTLVCVAHRLVETHRDAEAVAAMREGLQTVTGDGLSEWDLLARATAELQPMIERQQHRQVIHRTRLLLAVVDDLVREAPPTEHDRPVDAPREAILDKRRQALGIGMSDWEGALRANESIQQSMASRQASIDERTVQALWDFLPLLRLGRLDDAERVVLACQAEFEKANDEAMLGQVLRARADIASHRGHHTESLHLSEAALRNAYTRGVATEAGMDHFNHANHLVGAGGELAEILAHNLAATLLLPVNHGANSEGTAEQVLALRLAAVADAPVPNTVESLADVVERIPGVRFRELLTDLIPESSARDSLLTTTLRKAQGPASSVL